MLACAQNHTRHRVRPDRKPCYSPAMPAEPLTAPPLPALPKVELHCHLDGIIDPPMARDLLAAGVSLPFTEEELAGRYPVTGMDSFLKWYDVGARLEGRLAPFFPIIAAHIERLKTQGVVYTEIMIAGSEIPDDPVARLEQVGAFRRHVDRLEAGKIQVEFLMAVGKGKSPDRIRRQGERALSLHQAGLICGFCLAGLEQGYPVRPYREALAELREAGLGIAIHAGEWAGPESVWEALDNGRPHRIGHGTHAFADPRLVRHLADHRIHLEMCPTSNLCTGSIARLTDHPVRRAWEAGVPFSIATDDPGIFRNTIAGEYRLLADTFGFAADDLLAVTRAGLAARFQPTLRGPAAALADG